MGETLAGVPIASALFIPSGGATVRPTDKNLHGIEVLGQLQGGLIDKPLSV
jgi:hypothetical protein